MVQKQLQLDPTYFDTSSEKSLFFTGIWVKFLPVLIVLGEFDETVRSEKADLCLPILSSRNIQANSNADQTLPRREESTSYLKGKRVVVDW